MEKPSTKDIQDIAAGALALMGLQEIIRLAHDLIVGSELAVLITSSSAALALPLAIGILARSHLALRLTQLYLWLAVIAGWITVAMLLWILPWQRLYPQCGGFVISLVLLTILLGEAFNLALSFAQFGDQ